jgi:hypothetical protein
LSVHALTEYVPEVGNVYEGEVAVPVPAAARVAIEEAVRSVIAPPPAAAVATWKKLKNDDPVEPVPLFVIVAENVTGVPAVPVDGAAAPAVRFGVDAAETGTVKVAVASATPAFEQVRV